MTDKDLVSLMLQRVMPADHAKRTQENLDKIADCLVQKAESIVPLLMAQNLN